MQITRLKSTAMQTFLWALTLLTALSTQFSRPAPDRPDTLLFQAIQLSTRTALRPFQTQPDNGTAVLWNLLFPTAVRRLATLLWALHAVTNIPTWPIETRQPARHRRQNGGKANIVCVWIPWIVQHRFMLVLRPWEESPILEIRFQPSRHIRCVLTGSL